jgi:hypothetical protein
MRGSFASSAETRFSISLPLFIVGGPGTMDRIFALRPAIVLKDDGLDREIVLHRRRHFRHQHGEPAISNDRDEGRSG